MSKNTTYLVTKEIQTYVTVIDGVLPIFQSQFPDVDEWGVIANLVNHKEELDYNAYNGKYISKKKKANHFWCRN